jgi:hypothetical protein
VKAAVVPGKVTETVFGLDPSAAQRFRNTACPWTFGKPNPPPAPYEANVSGTRVAPDPELT